MRDCANCFHRKPVLKEDGTWTAECEKWDCEFQSRENMIEKTEAKGGDLISRSALKKAVEELVVGGAEGLKNYYENGSKSDENSWIGGVYDAWELIDNAPTVEPQKVPIANVTFDTEKLKELTDDIVERIKSGEIVLQDERPKGEWIETQRGIHVTDYKCSCCGRTVRDDTGYNVANDYPFCHCGADMREETSVCQNPNGNCFTCKLFEVCNAKTKPADMRGEKE